MPTKIPPFRGGGSWFFGKGGVEVPILVLWAWGFFRMNKEHRKCYADIVY